MPLVERPVGQVDGMEKAIRGPGHESRADSTSTGQSRMPVHTRDRLAFFAGAAVTTLRDAFFGCGVLQVVAPSVPDAPSRLFAWSTRVKSFISHPLRRSAYRPDWSMLVNIRAHSPRPPPIPGMQQRGRYHTADTASGVRAGLSERCLVSGCSVIHTALEPVGSALAAAISARGGRSTHRAVDGNHAPLDHFQRAAAHSSKPHHRLTAVRPSRRRR